MTDQEKLVELLAHVMTNAMCTGSDNGRVVVHYVSVEQIADHLLAHGVTVRKPQKPLTLEDLRRIEEQPVWCETEATRTPCVVKCSLIDKEDAIFYALGSEYPIFFSIETYGQIWRCWAEKPRSEEREAAEWME